MANSGVGQFSINVRSNLRDFYGELVKAKRTMDELTNKKRSLEVDSKQLDQLRDKAQRIAAEMRELRQQKNEIKLGIKQVDNVESAIKNIDRSLSSLNRQKLAVEADIQPIRTANAELYKVNGEIDRINAKKININVGESLTKLGTKVSSFADSILKAFNPLTSKLNQMIGFGLINNLIDKGLNMITSSVDGAISRVDTLNNYVKVMSNLNISEEDALASKNRLVEGLEGLPTILDSGVAAVQRFTSSNKDISKSTETYLALNNALLAGRASQEIQSSALEQISQAYAKGKPDMVEWRSLLTAMPAQVSQIAESFGTTSDQLGEDLRNGKRSMSDFMDRIIQLNTDGTGSYKSFEEQAKNTVGGVKTGITRMNTAVTRGMAKIISSIDEAGKKSTFGGISDMLGKIGSLFEKGLGKVAELIEQHSDKIFEVLNKFIEFIGKVDFISFFKGLWSGIKEVGEVAKSAYEFIKPLLGSLGGENTAENIGKLIPKIFLLGVGLKILGTASQGLGGLLSILGKFTKFKMPKFFSGNSGGKTELPLQGTTLTQLKELGMKMLTLAGLSANIFLAAKALQEVSKLDSFESLQPKLLAIAEAIVGMGLIVLAIDKITKVLKPDIVSGLLTIVGIAGTIYLMAVAIKKVGEIDSNFGRIQAKIGQIALVIVEIGALALVVGAIMMTGFGAVALVAGLVAIIGIAGTLYLTGLAIKEIGEMNLNEKSIKKNIKSIYRCIEETAKYSFNTNIFEDIYNFIANFIRLGIIKQFLEMGNQLKRLQEFDLDQYILKDNIKAINKCIALVSEMGTKDQNQSIFGDVVKFIRNFMKLKIIDELIIISEQLSRLQQVKLNVNKITKNLKIINKVFSKLAQMGEKTNFKSIISNVIDYYANITQSKIIDSLMELTDQFKRVQEINLNQDKIVSNLSMVFRVMGMLQSNGEKTGFQNIFANIIDLYANITQSKILDTMLKVSDQLKQLESANFNQEKVIYNLSLVFRVLTMLQKQGKETGLKDIIKNIIENYNSIIQSKILDTMLTISNLISKIQNIKLNKTKIFNNLKLIRETLKYLAQMGQDKLGKNIIKNIVDNYAAITQGNVLGSLIGIAGQLNQLQKIKLNTKNIRSNLNKINQSMQILNGFSQDATISDSLNSIGDTYDKIAKSNLLEVIKEIAIKLVYIQSIEFDKQKLFNNFSVIKNAINKLSNLDQNEGISGLINDVIDFYSKIIAANLLGVITDIANKLYQLQGIELDEKSIQKNMNILATFFYKLKNLGEDSGIMDIISNYIDFVNKLITSDIIATLIKISGQILELQKIELDETKATGNLDILTNIIKNLTTESFIDTIKNWLKGSAKLSDLENATEILKEFNRIAKELSNLQKVELDTEVVEKNIEIIKNAIESISKLVTSEIVDNLSGFNEALSEMTTILFEEIPPEFEKLGEKLAESLNKSFKGKLDFKGPVNDKLGEVSTNKAETVGTNLASKLNEIFAKKLNLTDTIVKAINNALNKNYTAKINVETNNSSSSASSSNSSNSRNRDVVLASGGKVTTGNPGVNIVDAPTPTMASNGEYIIPKKIVDKLGTPFFNNLRNGLFSPTFAKLGRSISNTSSNVYNYVYNTTNNHQEFVMNTTATPDAVVIANRRLRGK